MNIKKIESQADQNAFRKTQLAESLFRPGWKTQIIKDRRVLLRIAGANKNAQRSRQWV